MARGRIQGITIEIGGDTTKLTKALKSVNNEIYSAQRQLNDVNKLLKMDPSNTELLAQKQKALEQAIGGTKQKLAELQKVSKDSVSDEEWDAVQREIIETQQKLDKLEGEYKEFGSISAQQVKAAGENVKSVGDKIGTVGGAMTKGVTVPIAAVGAASVAAFKEVDSGLDTVEKKTGATGEALKELEDATKNIATNIPTDFQTAGEAVGEVNTRFGLTGKELEKLSEQFVKFAELNETDVSTSIDQVQASMSAFGIPAKDASLVLDALNKAGQDTGVSMDTLSADLTKNAASLKGLGMSYSDSANFLAQLNKNGIDSSAVMAGLRKAYVGAAKDGKTLDQALSEMQSQMQGAGSDTEATAIAIEMFGNRAGPALADAIREGRLSFEDLGTSLQDYAGNVSSTFDQTLDPIDQMNMAMNEAKLIGTDIVVAAAPMILEVLGALRDILGTVREAWEAMPAGMQSAIVSFALVVAAIGPILSIVGKLVSTIGTIMTYAPQIMGAVSSLGGALSGLWGVLMANPIVLVVAAIAALVAAFVIAWNKSEAFRNFWIGLWDGIKKAVSDAVDSVKQFCSDIASAVGEMWKGVKEKVSDGVDKVKEYFGKVVSFIKGNWQGLLTFIVNPFAGAFKLLYDNCDGFRKKVDSLMTSVKKLFTDGFNKVKSVVGGVVNWLKGIFDFHWSLPPLKLPHFKISGSFSLNPPSVPSFGIDWYRKAMEGGMILNSPTIFGMAGGRFLGGGEAGAEAVVGVDSLQSMITGAVAAAGAGGNIVIPVYIGQERIDEIVVDATSRINYRSGGR